MSRNRQAPDGLKTTFSSPFEKGDRRNFFPPLKKGIEGISSPFEKGGLRGIYFKKSLLTSSFDSAQDMLFQRGELNMYAMRTG
jgi:hypothetical protein